MSAIEQRSEELEYEVGHHPDLPPPARTSGVIGWVRQNLLSSYLNGFLTVATLALLIWMVPPILKWAVFDAQWTGTDRSACTGEGACWVFVHVWFKRFIYGLTFPLDQAWRINLGYGILLACGALLFVKRFPWKLWVGLFLFFVYPVILYFLFLGGAFGLPEIETARWGGLALTILVAGVGIVASLPIGIVFALGRRSKMPVIRILSVCFIELWRGVPLITVLFMASVMLPLFLPEGVNFDKLLRVLIGVSLFSAAYMAEVVRGGLQAIPKGQSEAAAALGLSYWKSTALIVLPQALKLVIPGIVNSFIGLFMDTSLVLIVGLFDLLGTVQAAATNAQWLGFWREGYVFAGLVFWIFCFGMSRYSQWLERKLHTGHQKR
jgi:general L-amino acid transport system permease protein